MNKNSIQVHEVFTNVDEWTAELADSEPAGQNHQNDRALSIIIRRSQRANNLHNRISRIEKRENKCVL